MFSSVFQAWVLEDVNCSQSNPGDSSTTPSVSLLVPLLPWILSWEPKLSGSYTYNIKFRWTYFGWSTFARTLVPQTNAARSYCWGLEFASGLLKRNSGRLHSYIVITATQPLEIVESVSILTLSLNIRMEKLEAPTTWRANLLVHKVARAAILREYSFHLVTVHGS